MIHDARVIQKLHSITHSRPYLLLHIHTMYFVLLSAITVDTPCTMLDRTVYPMAHGSSLLMGTKSTVTVI